MALGLPTSEGAGDRTPVVKYDARAGRIFRVDRSQASGSWESTQIEIPANVFQAVMDIERIEVGWLYFPSGAAPSIQVVPYGQPLPPKPSDNHRGGFRVLMLLGKQSGGDVREMAANAKVTKDGMDDLHDAYLAGVKDHPGKLPVVKLARTEAVTTSGKDETGKQVNSTNYRPVWEIVKWVDRPPELVAGQPANEPKAEPQQELRTTQQAKPEPEPAPAVEDDF